jgi:hypothetical protein
MVKDFGKLVCAGILVVIVLLLADTARGATGWQPYTLPLAAHDVQVVNESCGGSAGCYGGGDTVTLAATAYGTAQTLLEQQPKVPLAEMVYLHELGHWFDAHEMTSADREAFEALIGVAQDWMAGMNPPGEKFAQAFMLCALYPVAPKRWPTMPTWGIIGYGYGPNVRQHRAACALIAAVVPAA